MKASYPTNGPSGSRRHGYLAAINSLCADIGSEADEGNLRAARSKEGFIATAIG
jgi:hypothetical protein